MATKVIEGFRRIAGFANVFGCLDCTQIRISTPHENEADYVNRKGFHNGDVNGILLGDSGYPLTKYLLTPYLTPRDPSEERSNSSLCRTRVVIEQTFGILKRKFQALHFGLRTIPDQAVTYVTACCILQNIGVERKDTMISSDSKDLNIAEPHVVATRSTMVFEG
ncbi:putative nuclease HARBI1 [Saccostrea cucullata]|uniref:putative nuclease HARBI1 n=1 Tax=Saccostrea cuccullata TaxID=36930 RepID=UPI002ED1BBBD